MMMTMMIVVAGHAGDNVMATMMTMMIVVGGENDDGMTIL